MLRCKKTTVALLFTLVMTAVVTVLRVTLVPRLQSMDTGVFNLSYIVVAGIVVSLIAVFVLLVLGKKDLPYLPSVNRKWVWPFAAVIIAAGACILLTTLVDMFMWAAFGVTPPPNTAVSSTVDQVTLFLSLILGALGGIYFMRLGVEWIRAEREVRGAFPVWALAPTFWLWMRLARYEVSYASAVEVHESFYDFTMLLFGMLFLFSLARQLSDTAPHRPHLTVFFALSTVLTGASGALARVILFLLGQGEASRSGQLAGVEDFAVGVLAVAFVCYWLLSDPSAEPLPETEVSNEEEVVVEQEENTEIAEDTDMSASEA